MIRFILYIILTYIIFYVIKFVLKFFRKTPIQKPPVDVTANKEKEILDKSKIVDADFEEIK